MPAKYIFSSRRKVSIYGEVKLYIERVITWGARVISPAQHTRVAGVSIFIFNSVSSLEAGLCAWAHGTGSNPSPPGSAVSGLELATQISSDSGR